MEVLVSTTKLILVLRILYLYYEVYPGLTELILVLLNLFLYFRSYTGSIELIHIKNVCSFGTPVRVIELILIQNLYL